MALAFAALVPYPKKLAQEPETSDLAKTRAGILNVKKLIKDNNVDTLIVVSSHLLQPMHAYSTTPGDPAAYYMLGLDKLQTHINQTTSRDKPSVFNNDVELIRFIRERARPFSYTMLINPNVKIDEPSSIALELLEISAAQKVPAIVSIVLPYVPPSDLFEFGLFLGRIAKESDKKIGLIAVGDLSARLSKGSPAGFRREGKLFDDLVITAAKQNDFMPIITADQALLEKAGESAARPLAVAAGASLGLTAQVESYEAPNGTGYATLTWS